MDTLSASDIDSQLKTVDGWTLQDEKLYKKFVFKNFVDAFGFMTKAAIGAEQQNHHPEWSNVYKTVEVYLTTHEAGGITEKDFKLAAWMDNVAS